jgi:hypothetical protein
MDPLVSLYYYAPVCTVMNFLVAAATEFQNFRIDDVWKVGLGTLLLNAMLAFALNGSSVFLLGKTSGLVMTLCGVLKNILLVLASVLLWGTVISPIQALGYSIALVGLIYYGVGYEGILTYISHTQKLAKQVWEGESPEKKFETTSTGRGKGGVLRKVLLVSVFTLCVVGLVAGFTMRSAKPHLVEEAKKGWLDLDGP